MNDSPQHPPAISDRQLVDMLVVERAVLIDELVRTSVALADAEDEILELRHQATEAGGGA